MLPPVVARSSAFRYITHFDFSDNSAYIQSNCGAYELLFFNTNDGSEVLAPSALKDEVWASQTCVLGWPVQGLWPELTDGIEINGSDRSNCGKYIVRPSSNFPPPSRPADDQLLLYPAAIDSPPHTHSPPTFLPTGFRRQPWSRARVQLSVLEARVGASSRSHYSAAARSGFFLRRTLTHRDPVFMHPRSLALLSPPSQAPVDGHAHASTLTAIRFSADDKTVVTIGGEDRCTMQWRLE